MSILRCCVLAVLGAVSGLVQVGDTGKQAAGNTWAKIVVELVTPEVNKKALEVQQFAAVAPDFELNLHVKNLGAAGKFSIKDIREKYGPPAKVEQFATREGGKVVSYRKLYYPPIAFTVPVGGEQATTISGPKRLWAGGGILENARAALKTK